MNSISERIYEKINKLIKERDEIHNQINKLQQTAGSLKKHIHHTELEIIVEGASVQASDVPNLRMVGEMRELNKEKHDLHDNEKVLKGLTKKYNNLTKTIEDHRFWMHRADTTDPARQQEAEHKIFG